MKYVVVTGSSTGIGLGISRFLAEKGVHVFGTVRTEIASEKLKKDMGGSVTPVIMDVRNIESVKRAANEVAKHLPTGNNLWALVNNAGIAHFGPLALQPIAEINETFEINVLGAIQTTQAFLPLMGFNKESFSENLGKDWPLRRSSIINVSSLAGRIGTPFLGAYAASKHAMEGWSESLRRELLPYGIDVVIVGPGSVATPIWDKAEEEGFSQYKGTAYEKALSKFSKFMLQNGRRGLPVEDLGALVWNILDSKKPNARYTVAPDYMKNWLLPRYLPSRWMDRWIGSQLFHS